jgi:hypothetical protein
MFFIMSAIIMVVMMTITMCVMMTSSMMCVITMMDHVFSAMLCTATAAALGTTLGCCTKQIIERKSKQFHLNLYYTQT